MTTGEDKWTNYAYDIFKREKGLENANAPKPV